MRIIQLLDADFVNYKRPSMFIGFPTCTFKCDIEYGGKVCQNSVLATLPAIEVQYDELVTRYINNPITQAVVCGGLEPLDSMLDLQCLIHAFRKVTDDDIVIYTGYEINEPKTNIFHEFILDNDLHDIVIKYGRFIPGDRPHYDEVLGVMLASNNQQAIRV